MRGLQTMLLCIHTLAHLYHDNTDKVVSYVAIGGLDLKYVFFRLWLLIDGFIRCFDNVFSDYYQVNLVAVVAHPKSSFEILLKVKSKLN